MRNTSDDPRTTSWIAARQEIKEDTMSKALIFSDLHLHSHKDRVDRLHDCLKVLNWVFEQAAEHGCEYIFFLGDLFHERAKIDVLNYLRTFEVFMKHMIEDACGRKFYLLVGNHDMYHREKWDVNSVKPLTAIPNVSIIDQPTQLVLGGRKIDCLPHTENPVVELDRLKKQSGVGDLLLSHIAIHGAMTNVFYGLKSDVIVEYDNDMVAVDSAIFSDWQLVLLGHYHGAQKLGNVEYVGSPLQLSYGEAFQQKHVLVLDLDTLEKTYIVNDFSPKHLIVNVNDVEHENYDLNGNFVRLSVDDMSRTDLMDIQKKIEKSSRCLALEFRPSDQKVEAKDEKIVSESVQSVIRNIQEMLKVWMKENGLPDGMDEPECLKVGLQCLHREEEVPS